MGMLGQASGGGYGLIALLILLVSGAAAAIMLVTHIVGPKRRGPVKGSTYESGVDPISDARRRFNVRFYLVAVLFLVFDVEIIFLYPWAVLFPGLSAATGGELAAAGYNSTFFLVSIGIFFALLTVGFVYEWRKGIFKWD
jgi:NADH-quinone oxidoreductase subunit A